MRPSGDVDERDGGEGWSLLGFLPSQGVFAFCLDGSEDAWSSSKEQLTVRNDLFNDYDLPLSHVAFITLTHLGQEKWALGSNTGRCPSVNRSDGSFPFSDFKPGDINRSFRQESHIPSTSFLLNVLYILPLLCQMIQLSLKQSGCRGMQVRFKTTEIKLPCLFFNFIKQSTEVYHLQVPCIWLLGKKKIP